MKGYIKKEFITEVRIIKVDLTDYHNVLFTVQNDDVVFEDINTVYKDKACSEILDYDYFKDMFINIPSVCGSFIKHKIDSIAPYYFVHNNSCTLEKFRVISIGFNDKGLISEYELTTIPSEGNCSYTIGNNIKLYNVYENAINENEVYIINEDGIKEQVGGLFVDMELDKTQKGYVEKFNYYLNKLKESGLYIYFNTDNATIECIKDKHIDGYEQMITSYDVGNDDIEYNINYSTTICNMDSHWSDDTLVKYKIEVKENGTN